MIKFFTRLAVVAMAVIALASCKKEPTMSSDFLQQESYGMQIDGISPYVYTAENVQVAFNSGRKQFRVGTDTMSNYYVIELTELPSKEGQSIPGCTLVWTQSASVKTLDGLTFKVSKMESDGRIWLWCARKKIAVIVQKL